MSELTHLSLFSGIGGLDLAAEWAGFRTVGQCEWAEYPRAVLEKHWPGLPRWRDIRTLTGEDFFAKTGLRTVDVISGGFPCQPFSTAGKRRGKADDRYLWPEMLRVVSEIRPAWVVGENVAGIVSMVESNQKFRVENRTISRMPDEDRYEAVLSRQEDTLLVQIIEDIEHIGYEVQAFVIPACAVGAPHRRDRIAIVAYCSSIGLQEERAKQQAAGTPGVSENVADTDGGTVRYDCHDRRTSDREINKAFNAGLSGGTKEIFPTPTTGAGLCGWNRELSTTEGSGTEWSYLRRGAQEHGGGQWWTVEPDVGRVAHGVPSRLDRLRCLGNAVVPQQFYPIFKAIADVERIFE